MVTHTFSTCCKPQLGRPPDRARIWDRVQKSPQNRDFWTLLYFSGTCDVQEKGKSIPLALSNAAASSTFGDSSDDEQAILIVKGSNLRRCMLDRGGAQWPEHRKLDWKKLQARPA